MPSGADEPEVRMRVTVDDGVGLAVEIAGPQDAPGLLLVHGFGGAKEDFADHVGEFARDHRVVTFDHRGHGASDAPTDPAAYSLDRLAVDVRCLVDALGLRAPRLLGHSMGGMVTRRAALAEPGRYAALVFMDTSPGAPPGLDPQLVAQGAEVALTHGMAELRRLADGLDVFGSGPYRRVLASRPGFAEYVARKWASLSPVMWATLAPEMSTQPDQTDRLGELRMPALVLVGEHDRTFREPSRRLAGALGGDTRLAVLAGAGHSPQFESPEAWHAAVRVFLDGLA